MDMSWYSLRWRRLTPIAWKSFPLALEICRIVLQQTSLDSENVHTALTKFIGEIRRAQVGRPNSLKPDRIRREAFQRLDALKPHP